MTQEQKTMIGEHFDMLHSIATGIAPNIPDDISQAMKAAYMAGADYAIDMFAPRWISVEDELPKEYEDVLVYGTIVSGKEIGVDYISPVLEKGCTSEWRVFSEVTHWMPLPAPPKKED